MERFLVRLVSAFLAAVYATSEADCLFVDMAETLTMRAHSAFLSSGNAARIARTELRGIPLKTSRQSESLYYSKLLIPPGNGPAALTRALQCPQRSSTWARAFSTDS